MRFVQVLCLIACFFILFITPDNVSTERPHHRQTREVAIRALKMYKREFHKAVYAECSLKVLGGKMKAETAAHMMAHADDEADRQMLPLLTDMASAEMSATQDARNTTMRHLIGRVALFIMMCISVLSHWRRD